METSQEHAVPLLYNPYDFANPVSNKALFSGRKDEIDEIKYYLNQAALAPRPINIALLGARAAGKTSLLNMVELEALERRFCVARVDLNEGDAETQLKFFFKLFDAILAASCDHSIKCPRGHDNYSFGGKHGNTYSSYLHMISSFRVPESLQEFPFVFPIQYANAMGNRVFDCQISDSNYRRDLVTISRETKVPLAILFDECNVLSKNRIILEALRNIFMNLPGYLLVFTGTPDIFPIMDEVFSPIVRQFKKIEVGSFKEHEETESCIKKPLESIGIKVPSDIFEKHTLQELKEIHNVTGGRPYEIQLLCHFMFKRVQLGRDAKMSLSMEVFDDVLEELRRGKDIATRPIISKAKLLEDKELSCLDLILSCGGHGTFEHIWFVEYIINGSRRHSKEELAQKLQRFVDLHLISVKDSVLFFNADDFDRIYIKYLARQRNLSISFDDFPVDIYCYIRVSSFLKKSGLVPFDAIYRVANDLRYQRRLRIHEYVPYDLEDEEESIGSVILGLYDQMRGLASDVFNLYPGLSQIIYWKCIDLLEKKATAFTLVNITIESSIGVRQDLTFYLDPLTSQESISIEGLNESLGSFKRRVEEINGKCQFVVITHDVLSLEVLNSLLSSTTNREVRKKLASGHVARTFDYYFGVPNVESCYFHAHIGLQHKDYLEFEDLNNLGYMLMGMNNYSEAKEALSAALQKNPRYHVALYNKGMITAVEGDIAGCISLLESSLQIVKGFTQEELECICLFVPKFENGNLELSEVKEPNFLTTVTSVLESVRYAYK